MEARSQAYALAVPWKEQVNVQGERRRVDQVARQLEANEWQRLCAGSGRKGPRLFEWARVEVAKPEKEGWQWWLIIRRSLASGAKPADLAYMLVFAPRGTTLVEMVTVIGSRGTVEQCLEEAKGEVGLDEYEVRSWQGWSRHITLCMLAHAFLTVLGAQRQASMPPSDEQEGKKRWQPFRPHSPSQTLTAFKCQRGLACRSSSL